MVITGPDASRRRILAELVSDLRSKKTEIRQSEDEDTWESLLSDSMAMGLFEEDSAKVVDNPEELGPFPDNRLDLLEKDGKRGLLILSYGNGVGKFLSKKVLEVSTVKEPEKVPFWPSKKIPWLRAKARGKGLDLSQEGASLMVEFLEDDEELLSVLDTMVSLYGKGQADLKMVSDLVLNQGGKAMVNLLNCFSSRDLLGCLRVFSDLREYGEIIPVLSALQKRVRCACYVKKFGPGPAGKHLKMTAFQLKEAERASGLYSSEELISLMAGLIRLSMAERSSFALGWEGFESLTLEVLAS